MKAQIRDFIIQTFLFNEGTVSDNDALFDEGILDSIELPKLIVFLEEAFQVDINMMDVTIDNFNSIDAIAQVIQAKQNA